MFVPVKICHQSEVFDFHALIDSGAEQSLIDVSLVTRFSLPVEPLDTLIKAAGLGGQPLSLKTQHTKPILVTSGNHRELIQFFITHSP